MLFFRSCVGSPKTSASVSRKPSRRAPPPPKSLNQFNKEVIELEKPAIADTIEEEMVKGLSEGVKDANNEEIIQEKESAAGEERPTENEEESKLAEAAAKDESHREESEDKNNNEEAKEESAIANEEIIRKKPVSAPVVTKRLSKTYSPPTRRAPPKHPSSLASISLSGNDLPSEQEEPVAAHRDQSVETSDGKNEATENNGGEESSLKSGDTESQNIASSRNAKWKPQLRDNYKKSASKNTSRSSWKPQFKKASKDSAPRRNPPLPPGSRPPPRAKVQKVKRPDRNIPPPPSIPLPVPPTKPAPPSTTTHPDPPATVEDTDHSQPVSPDRRSPKPKPRKVSVTTTDSDAPPSSPEVPEVVVPAVVILEMAKPIEEPSVLPTRPPRPSRTSRETVPILNIEPPATDTDNTALETQDTPIESKEEVVPTATARPPRPLPRKNTTEVDELEVKSVTLRPTVEKPPTLCTPEGTKDDAKQDTDTKEGPPTKPLPPSRPGVNPTPFVRVTATPVRPKPPVLHSSAASAESETTPQTSPPPTDTPTKSVPTRPKPPVVAGTTKVKPPVVRPKPPVQSKLPVVKPKPPAVASTKTVPPTQPKPPPPVVGARHKPITETTSDPSRLHAVTTHTSSSAIVSQPVPASRRKSTDMSTGTRRTSIPSRPPPPVTRRASKETNGPLPTPRSPPSSDPKKTALYTATQSYAASSAEELSFSSGDNLAVINSRTDKEGFVYGMLDDGSTGLFPLSHMQECS